jgi:hypothetical protein
VAEAAEALGSRASAPTENRRYFTTESRRHGENKVKGKPEHTEMAEATEAWGPCDDALGATAHPSASSATSALSGFDFVFLSVSASPR